MLKRLFDLIACLNALLFLLPFFAVLTIMIRLDSPGPIFYRGVRIGRYGEPFRIFKFRSMVEEAEKLGSTATAHNDPRITPIGRFIRKYKIDELPQILNVLKGEMSIVGPRPEVKEHTDCYGINETYGLTGECWRDY